MASLLSSFLGANASASTDVPADTEATKNSQIMALLDPSTSPTTPPTKDKSKTTPDEELSQESDVSITGNALVPTVGLASDTENRAAPFDQVSIYVVRRGDSVSQIAKMYEVSVNTIYWANDLKKGDKLIEGSTLVILPVSGIKHIVSKGDTLKTVAKKYQADAKDIADFNGISEDAKLIVGDELIIPDGQNSEVAPTKATNSSSEAPSYSPSKSTSGYFINPLPTGPRIRKTQGTHDKYAIDIGAPAGTPIYAAASGTVVIARSGYNGGYGTLVVIKHSNGTETRYAHMSKLGTSAGKQVSQGEVIGYVGTTGHSTGNHLHYEVRGAPNNLR